MSTSAPPAPVSAFDVVRSLSPELKIEVFKLLRRECGEAVDSPDDGEWQLVEPEAVDEEAVAAFMAALPPSVRAAIEEPKTNLGDCIPAEDVLEQLKREDEERLRG